MSVGACELHPFGGMEWPHPGRYFPPYTPEPPLPGPDWGRIVWIPVRVPYDPYCWPPHAPIYAH